MIKLFYTIVLFSYIKSICIEQKYYQSLKTSIHFASHAINAIDNNETSQLKLKENTIPENTLETSSDKKEISKNEPETKIEDYDQFRKNKLKDIRREVDQASKIESLRNKLIEKKKNLESLKLDYELKNLKDQEEEIMARISQNKIFITRHIIRYEFLVNLNYLKMIDNGKKNRFGSKDYWKYKKKTTIGKGMKKNIEKFRTTKTNLLIELMSTREKITEIQLVVGIGKERAPEVGWGMVQKMIKVVV
ncbi:MAG: hypothetical protein MHPSP_003504, partial [Paramarteilia canceri]